MTNESIFHEEAVVYNSAKQRRYWSILVVVLCLITAFRLYFTVWQFQVLRGGGFARDYFNFVLNILDTAFTLLGAILFYKKRHAGWVMSAATIVFRGLTTIPTIAYLIRRGELIYAAAPAIPLLFYAATLYAIQRPIITAMYGVKRPTIVKTFLATGFVYAIVYAVEVAEQYWRLNNTR